MELSYAQWVQVVYANRRILHALLAVENGHSATKVATTGRVSADSLRATVKRARARYAKYRMWCKIHGEAGLPPPRPI